MTVGVDLSAGGMAVSFNDDVGLGLALVDAVVDVGLVLGLGVAVGVESVSNPSNTLELYMAIKNKA